MLKRYTVVMYPNYDKKLFAEDIYVEYYTAESYDHAKEQAIDANPREARIATITRDPNPSTADGR
jgi:hypothetical protein